MPNFTRQQSGAHAVRTVMENMGMTPPATVVGGNNAIANQMFSLATTAGQRLIDAHDWQVLSRDFTITTQIGVSSYALPDDLNRFVNDSSWNHTTRLPAVGSLREYEWQMLKARQLAGTTFTMLYRIADDAVEFYDVPSVVQTIVMPYVSRGWCMRASGDLADNLEFEDDIVFYDPQLFQAAIKAAWYKEKGFNTAGVAADYNNALAAAKSKDVPGRTLSLSKKSDYPYLGVINMPDTGYGT